MVPIYRLPSDIVGDAKTPELRSYVHRPVPFEALSAKSLPSWETVEILAGDCH
jgi:hypothetical protein